MLSRIDTDVQDTFDHLKRVSPEVTRALVRLLSDQQPRFGTVSVTFEAGKPTGCEKRETFKA